MRRSPNSHGFNRRLLVSDCHIPVRICRITRGETPEHIIVRKEAERVAGAGEFWWGLGASLGVSVEVMAQRNGGTLPALFSKSKGIETQQNSEVRIWNAWRSVLHPDQQGRIPGHIIVTSGHDPKKRQTRFAFICRSAVELALGTVGFCELERIPVT